MQGFFSKKETESLHRVGGKSLTCFACGLYRDVHTAKMKPTGGFKKHVMLIGEAPTEADDSRGKHWQDRSGQLLEESLESAGIDLHNDCISINAINCYPGGRLPSPHELNCCRRIVFSHIKEYQPKLIILLGMPAVISLIGQRFSKDMDKIDKWRGFVIPDQDLKCYVAPTFAPGLVLSKGSDYELFFKQDIKKAVDQLKEPWKRQPNFTMQVLEDLTPLYTIPTGSTIAFDYETTGLKPHAIGHRVVCVAVATSSTHCYVFKMPVTKEGRKPFLDLLANPGVYKIAQNMKYEDHWSNVVLRQPVESWAFDTMLASHLLDNRDGVTGLKFQAYVRLGIVDYSSEIARYLQAPDTNSFNNIMELTKSEDGLQRLMKYCASDAIYTYRIAEQQIEELDYDFLPF